MATTAKTILLREDGNFISPATNIESLYYEVEKEDVNGINYYYRHSILNHWPIYVNYNNIVENDYAIKQIDEDVLDISKYNETVVLDDAKGDILVSRFTHRRILGTNYYALDVSNYNLSKILFSYAPKVWTNIQIKEVSIYCDNTSAKIHEYVDNVSLGINSSIKELYEFVETHVDPSIKYIEYEIDLLKDNYLNLNVYTWEDLNDIKNNNSLIPGYVYRMTYYPNFMKAIQHPFDLYLLADSSSAFSNIVAGCILTENDTYFENNELDKWKVIYDFDSSTILNMVDEFNNECNFDFKNMHFLLIYTFEYMIKSGAGYQSYDHSLTGNCVNNKVLSASTLLITYNNSNIIDNNYVGYNNSLTIYNTSIGSITNLNIGNDNSIYVISPNYIKNIEVGNNNTNIIIGTNNSSLEEYNIDNIDIKNNNTSINIEGGVINNVEIGNNNNSISYNNYYTQTSITAGTKYYNEINNIIMYDNNSSIFEEANTTIIYDNCYNILIQPYKNSGQFDNAKPLNNIVINASCSSLNIKHNIITVGPNYYDLTTNNSNTYYTYLNIIARSFEE